MQFEKKLSFAKDLDQADPLASYRDRFYHPIINGKSQTYLCGNSLGLQPKSVRDYLNIELEDWATLGVEGHMDGRNPWYYYHHFVEEVSAELLGAKTQEVAVMNALSVNLNLMMVSFYRPTATRNKILIEAKAFPSDQYAVEMQTKFHGFDPKDSVVELPLREGEHTHRPEDILAKIEELGDSLALVLIGGVNYYTGQLFDMQKITAAGHKAGAQVGFDLAHACGNVKLELHNWGPDFAVWCSYKYLNSGPGGVSGCFVHERHANKPDLPRFAGWWGNDEKTRFEMKSGFNPQLGAAGWQMSNAPVLPMAAYKASLDIFKEAGLDALCAKSAKLTAYFRYLLEQINDGSFEIITPAALGAHGCQISILTDNRGRAIFDALAEKGIIADWREPNVIRLAPVPLYNRFEDLFRFTEVMESVLTGSVISN
ncbi:MAG: kynureninase [Limisphaerales bacterium]|jgi:kynureninase